MTSMKVIFSGSPALRALHSAWHCRPLLQCARLKSTATWSLSKLQQNNSKNLIARSSDEEAEIAEDEISTPPPPPPASASTSSSAPSFQDLGLDKRLLGGLAANGLHVPTDVQLAAIPEIMTGGNIAVQCYTGSGKTLAYLLPVLTLAIQRYEAELAAATRKTAKTAGSVQAVIVVPSRELAMQIVRVAQSILPESARRAVQQCIGGANIYRQMDALKLYKPLMVVGTPGRLAELSRDGSLQTHRCSILVLDEADQLLAPQFREEMSRVCGHTGKRADNGRQTVMVSATLTPRVMALCEPWCPQPRQLFVGAVSPAATQAQEEDDAAAAAAIAAGQTGDGAKWGWGAPGTTYNGFAPTVGSAGGYGNQDSAPAIAPGLVHYFVSSAPQHRVDTLRRAIHAVGAQRALVFMNFQQRLKDAEMKLAARKMRVGSLHGELTKQERQATLTAFRAGKFRALLVSDVAARGLDIPECDAVFNLELPSDAAHYAHRAGRTGRAGRDGTVVSLVSGGEKFVIEKLGRRLGVEIKEVALSHGEFEDPSEYEDAGEKAGKRWERRERKDRSADNTADSSPDHLPAAAAAVEQ